MSMLLYQGCGPASLRVCGTISSSNVQVYLQVYLWMWILLLIVLIQLIKIYK